MPDLTNEANILAALDAAIVRTGYVGDTRPPKLVFLASHTRFLDRPVSVLIKGPSGCGKSHALSTGLKFIPGHAFEMLHGMSEKALPYSNLDLKHKHLAIQEAAGMASGSGAIFLRQLLSEGRLRYMTVQSTEEGLESVELTMEGPTGLFMTTTANSLHPEDESRMLSWHMDESAGLIRQVLMSQALGLGVEPTEDELEEWHFLSDLMEEAPKDVEIPFAPEIVEGLPVTHHKVQRDFPQVLALIKAHALLHYCTGHRERGDASGAVIADLRDYRAVRDLVEDTLAQGLEVEVRESVAEVVETVDYLTHEANQRGDVLPPNCYHTASQIDLVEYLGRDGAVISRNVRKAIEDGYLVDDNPGQGRLSQLRKGERDLPAGRVLPLPEELARVTKKPVGELLPA